MDEETRLLLEAVKKLSDRYNEMADAFIRFSGQYATVSQLIHDLEHPKLFDNDKESTC